MKKRKYFMYAFMLMILTSAGCSSQENVSGEAGSNPYYEELNRLIVDGYEFHLGDTLRQIGERYEELSLSEEIQLIDKDSDEGTHELWNGQSVIQYKDTADINVVYDSETQYPLLRATVVNNTGKEVSSYDLPISRYDKDNFAVEIPETILKLLREHKGDEEWSSYNPDTLCYTRLTSEEGNRIYTMTALVTVYEDETFQRYLQYDLEGLLAIRTDEDIARQKEDLKTIGRLYEMTEKQIAMLDEKERFIDTALTVKSVTMGLPRADKTRDYGDKVLDFVNSGRNSDYFMTKGDITYTILEPYGDLLQKQDLVHTTDLSYTFQPVTDTLEAYGSSAAADTVWYTLGDTEEESELLVLPAVTNFSKRTVDTMDGRVAQVRQYGGDYIGVTLPESVEAAIMEYWLEGESAVSEYKYDKELITVSYSAISNNGRFLQFYADVTPTDYPEITIRYKVMVSLADGNVTDAEFGLKEYS